MLLTEIREIAKEHGLKTSRLSKIALVRLIQSSEGHFDCFATASAGICDQMECRWREDCLAKPKSGSN
jgi:hypothetical protein